MADIFDPFDVPSSIWDNELGVPWKSWDGAQIYDGNSVRMEPPNLDGGRFFSTFELEDTFVIEVSGQRVWFEPPTYNGSNARAWIGIYQSGAATQFIDDPDPTLVTPGGYGKSHKFWFGIAGWRTSFLFDTYTHYPCDLNELFNRANGEFGSEDFRLRFSRVGNNIEVHNFESGSFALWRTFTIERPSDPMFFEFVEVDWSSAAHAYTRYYHFDYHSSGIVVDTTPIDWLLQTSDHYPQIIGTFASAASVNIQLWEVTDGQNTEVPVVSGDCYQIGNTGRWGWSTVYLPVTTTYQRQYFYTMTADNDDTFTGQFFLALPENAKWIHPNSFNEYLVD